MSKKYNLWLDDDNYRANEVQDSVCDEALTQAKSETVDSIPNQMRLNKGRDPGICLGKVKQNLEQYFGIPQGTEGNLVIIGGNGSGKGLGVVKPTLGTWKGALCVTDVKGELSAYYMQLYQQGVVTRPYIIFNPLQLGGMGYDPFNLLEQCSEADFIDYIREISCAIHPSVPNDSQPFWRETEQGVLAAAVAYFFNLGLSFSETMVAIASSTMTELVKEIEKHGGEVEKMFLGEIHNMKPESLASLDRGLRNSVMTFATNPNISQALRGKRENAKCFTWDDLDNYNIFLCVPEERIELWGRVINLMYAQLIQHLERRPDKYSPRGAENMQTLLLMDEFARFGKLEIMPYAISTLRSKCVNICLVLQSIAQLDKTYGGDDRRIIMDNCQYQAILRVNDAETQEYCSKLIGKHKELLRGFSESWDDDMENFSSGRQVSEAYEYKIQPHKLSTLQDIWLLTPLGIYYIDKIKSNDWIMDQGYKDLNTIFPTEVRVISSSDDLQKMDCVVSVRVLPVDDENVTECCNEIEEIEILSIEERVKKVKEKIEKMETERRIDEKKKRENKEKEDKRRNYLIGELVSKYFPEILLLKVENKEQHAATFKPLEAFLKVLSEDTELVAQLKKKAAAYSTDNITAS